MKNHTRRVAFAIMAAILIFSFACKQSPGGAGSTEAPSPATTQGVPSPEESPSLDNTKQSGEFVQAVSNGYLDYELSGLEQGSSRAMNLEVRNKTERVWEVSIEVGTKLEPEDGNVQRMVVTKEYEIEIQPNTEQTLEIEVSCLDITKSAPSAQDKGWRVIRSDNLAQFIACANSAISELERTGKVEAEARPGLIQGSLWQARGATREEWLSFLRKKLTEEEAEQTFDTYSPLLTEIGKNCPSLLNI